MLRLDELLDVMRARSPSPVLDRRTGMPYGWSLWLRSQPVRILPFSPEQVATAVAGHLPPRPPRWPRRFTGFWPSLRSLLWQHWDPPPADQRRLRRLAALGSVALHLLLAALLMVLAWVHLPPPQASDEAGIRVEFLGRGSEQEGGGGLPAAAAAQAAQAGSSRPAGGGRKSPAAAAARSQAAPSSSPAPPAPPAAASPAVADAGSASAAPVSPPPPPLQATEVPQPTRDFVVPPPPALPVPPPPMATPSVQVRERAVQTVQSGAVPAPQVAARTPAMALPVPPPVQVREREVQVVQADSVPLPRMREQVHEATLPDAPTVQVRERAVADPLVAVPALQVQARAPATAAPAMPEVQVRQRALPAVSGAGAAPAAAQAQGEHQPASSDAAVAGAGQARAPEPATGTDGANASRPAPAAGRTPGSGPQAAPRAGGWDAANQADDWGLGQRDRAGAVRGGADRGQGLVGGDGRARVPGGGDTATPPRGAPGGESDSWTRERIAQSGTWLKRPPYDYQPTEFDQYWVPNESLLEEWVRKGIKKIEIPIPGSKNRISCVISLLQFGGGCGLANPDMNDQPASARPPPDIPFKKHLQEDNGSVR